MAELAIHFDPSWKEKFQREKALPAWSLVTSLRRLRAGQIKEWLQKQKRLDSGDFDREIWSLESETLLDGESILGELSDPHGPGDENRVKELMAALDKGRLSLHGNYIWGSPTLGFGPHMEDAERKGILDAGLKIATDPGLEPQGKAKQLLALEGFGRNLATGLVMVLHPDSLALFSPRAVEGMKRIGGQADGFESFQESARRLKDFFGAEDFLELDWFLYRVSINALEGEEKLAGLVRKIKEIQFPEERLETRKKSEEAARELLARKAGQFEEKDVREFFALVSKDWWDGKVKKDRFSPAFIGAFVKNYVEQLLDFNTWARKIWEVPEDKLEKLLQQVMEQEPLYATKLLVPLFLYLRFRGQYNLWFKSMEAGLKVLTGYSPGRRKAADYLRYNKTLNGFRETHGLDFRGLDVLLTATAKTIPEPDFGKLKSVIERFAQPYWENPTPDFDNRPGGGERYIHEKVLAGAAPHLTEEALRANVKEHLLEALHCHKNLLSAYEYPQAKLFIENQEEDTLRSRILALLFGPEELIRRIRTFLDWAKLRPSPEPVKKMGFTPLVCSYFLAMHDPREYAFLKPSVYSGAVKNLLPVDPKLNEPAAKIVHCTDLYKKILPVLERDYGLEGGNLLDVHSILFGLQYPVEWDKDGRTPWDILKEGGAVHVGETDGDPGPPPPEADHSLFNLLLDGHNAICYGPPGTGKTREAHNLGEWWKRRFGDNTVHHVTFHPSYSYEDFIEGYRPKRDGKGFALKDGLFKKVCQEADASPDTKHLLIIDEINRGDVARILGELITLIEGDKRGPAYSTLLPQSGEKFQVPENLYLVGTMNTADKSISLMDLAIRRRFRFLYFPPDPDVLSTSRDHLDEVGGLPLASLLVGLNRGLLKIGVDRDRQIGHSYLLIRNEVEHPLEILKQRLEYEILPLVEEYCYADRSLMTQVLGDLVDNDGARSLEVWEDDSALLATLSRIAEVTP